MGGTASGRNILSSSEKYGLRGDVAGWLGSEGKERHLPGAGSAAVENEIVLLLGCHAPSLRVRHRFAVFL